MPHFFINKEEIKKNVIKLADSDNFHHIVKVRRAKIGEDIKFIDNDKNIYFCKIKEISKNSLVADIIEKQKSDRFLKNKITLIQSILANDGQSILISNAVQAGVDEIYPVISDNTSTKVNDEKIVKWDKIALEAAKQCERADRAKINPIAPMIQTILKFKKENVLIFVEKNENMALDEALKTVDKKQNIVVVIGPEGGFSQDEFEYFIKYGYKCLTLGKLIYKAPNAVVAAISNVTSRIE